MPNYHYRLPDGQEYGWNGSVAKLKREHPDAIITGRVAVDALGQGRLVAYQGSQEGPVATVADETPSTDEEGTAAKPSKSPAKPKGTEEESRG